VRAKYAVALLAGSSTIEHRDGLLPIYKQGGIVGRGLQRLALPIAVAAGLQAWFPATAIGAEPAIVDRPSSRQLEEPEPLPAEQEIPFQLPPVVEPEAPAAGPTEYLEVKGFVFEGNHAVATEVLQKMAAPYAQRKVSGAELEELRQKLSRYYVEKGYINSGALLPEGFYRDGVVHVRIIEGHIQEIRAKGLGRLRESYLQERLVSGDEPLNVNALQERFELLLTDPLFAKINSRLQPGAAPGEAILDVDVTRARPWELAVFYNNYNPPSIGAEAVGVSGLVRDLTGRGDALDLTLQQGVDRNGRGSLGWTIPIVYRTDFHARYDHGESSVLEEPVSAIDVGSILDSLEIGISHALVETLTRRISVGLTLAHRENSTTLLGEPFSFVPGEPTGTSKVNDIRFDQELVQRWERQALAARSTFTLGRTNVDPTAGPPDVVPAQEYFIWLGQVQFTRRVLENGASVLLRGTLQWTQNRLVPLEQIAVGGVASVHGYLENQLVRDQGYFVNLEFHYPLFDRPGDRNRFSLIPFFDFGSAWNCGGPREQLASVGLGLNWEFRGLSAELYYGQRLISPAVKTSGSLQADGIEFQIRYQF
jgi:hemolysin activation/secretion protein